MLFVAQKNEDLLIQNFRIIILKGLESATLNVSYLNLRVNKVIEWLLVNKVIEWLINCKIIMRVSLLSVSY